MADLNKTTETINRIIGQKLKGSERQIAKLYANTLNDIRKELAKLYEKYEVGGKLTYVEMAKYDRLTKFTEFLTELLTGQYKDLKTLIFDVLGESYQDGYYMTAWAVETSTLSKLAYSTVAAETILAAVDNPLTNLSERIHKNMVNSIFEIRQEVTQGLVQGDTYGKMAKRLKDKLDIKAYESIRVIRTEAHRVGEQSRLDSVLHAQKNGIVMLKEWNNRKDSRSRKTHLAADGQTIPVDHDFKVGSESGPAPGQLTGGAKENANCACFTTYTVEDVQKPDAKELENMAFEQWEKERLKKR